MKPDHINQECYDIKKETTAYKRKLKKTIIIVIIVLVAVLVFMFAAVMILDLIVSNLQNDEETYNFNFYNADYSENIFDDPEYIALIENGYISFSNMDNVTLSIDEEDAASYGKDVEFIVQYVKYMINGEVDKYNSCYSDLYYQKADPKENFTMQKIYDVNIKKISEQSVSENGQTYTKYVFSLNYRILNNNGTLRNDFLTGSRTQYLYITDRSGSLQIDGVTVLKTAVK